MKLKFFTLILLVLLWLGGSWLRLAHLDARAPFDWDQNRDYQKVTQILGGKLTLLGPVAKGDNGFYLGPLYYYLLVPGHLLSHGHPLAYPVTSVLLDLLAIAILGWGLLRRFTPGQFWLYGLFLCSWFLIENSRISWNVALLPLFMIILWRLTAWPDRLRSLLLYGFVAGLSWHIHATLLPLGIISILLFPLRGPRPYWQKLLYMFAGYFLATAPLWLFDLRHHFFNLNQMLSLGAQLEATAAPSSHLIVSDVIGKYGRNLLGLFGGPLRSSPLVGYLALLICCLPLYLRERQLLLPMTFLVTNLAMVLWLRDLRFPEYYLLPATLAWPMILSAWLDTLSWRRLSWGVAIIALAFVLALNLRSYQFEPGPFSLRRKTELILSLRELSAPLDLRYELAPGREGGLVPLARLYGLVVTESAPLKVVITDKLDGPITIGSELGLEHSRFGGYRSLYSNVQ